VPDSITAGSHALVREATASPTQTQRRAVARTIHSDIVRIADLGEADVQRWRELGTASVEPNPFVEPDFVLPSMRAWGVQGVGLLRVMDRADWLAAIPVVSVPNWRGVPGRCLVAWRHPYSYLGNPLISGDDVERVVTALVERGYRHSGAFGLEWIATDGPFDGALEQLSRVVQISEFERAALDGGQANNGNHLPTGQTAKKFRQKRRLLEHETGQLTVRDRSGDHVAACQRFLEIEADGWRGWSGTGTAMACIPGHGKFFTDMCAGFARLGRLRLRALEADGRMLAIASDLVAGNVLYFFKQAFDEQYARYSPGAQLELANMQAFQSQEWEMFDSCASVDNEVYNKLWPGRRTLRTVVVAGSHGRGALNHAKWRAATTVKPLGRRLQELPRAFGAH
jgi:CelD/BcsL family acetyltransferase involved in cellulose biosynthesis